MIRQLLPCLALSLITLAPAQAATLMGGRVGAEDPVALSAFYKSVFGLYEVNRFVFEDGGIEVMLNFGSSEADAKTNTNAEIVLMPRVTNDIDDDIPHLIFNVDDLDATMAAVKAAGGSMQTPEPISIPAGPNTIRIAIARDPANNLMELIQQP